jgi:hypothetical protein
MNLKNFDTEVRQLISRQYETSIILFSSKANEKLRSNSLRGGTIKTTNQRQIPITE